MDRLRPLALAAFASFAFCGVAYVCAAAEAEVPAPAVPEIISSGDTLELRRIAQFERPGENSAKRFHLGIPISIHPGVHLEVRDVVIHVFFYDLVDGNKVV